MMSTTFIGGLFDDESKDAEMVFKFAVQAINNQRSKHTDGLLEARKNIIHYLVERLANILFFKSLNELNTAMCFKLLKIFAK